MSQCVHIAQFCFRALTATALVRRIIVKHICAGAIKVGEHLDCNGVSTYAISACFMKLTSTASRKSSNSLGVEETAVRGNAVDGSNGEAAPVSRNIGDEFWLRGAVAAAARVDGEGNGTEALLLGGSGGDAGTRDQEGEDGGELHFAC